MKRTLSVTLEDNGPNGGIRTITVENFLAFTVSEVLCISEYLRMGARSDILASLAKQSAASNEKRAKKKKTPARKSKR